MKKFLAMMLAALIFLPAVSEAETVDDWINPALTDELSYTLGYDVPDIRVVAGNNVRLVNSGWNENAGYFWYEYTCDLLLDKRENFAAKFVKYLRDNNYPFVLKSNPKTDYISTSANFLEEWAFDYTGDQGAFDFVGTPAIAKVQLSLPALSNLRGHLYVYRFQHHLEDVTKIQIRVANGLTYGGGN